MMNPQRRRYPNRPPAFARTILAVLLAGSAGAQAQTWTGGGLTNLWSDLFNWSTLAPPISSSSTTITFAGPTKLGTVQNIATPMVINSLTFANGAGAFLLSGGGLRFGGATSFLIQNSSTAVSIANGILIDENLTYSGVGSATLAGAVSRSGSNSAENTRLTKTGAGTLTLSTANSFDGIVAIDQGQVRLGHGSALQSASVLLQTNGGLNLNGLATATLGNLSGTGSLDLGTTKLSIGNDNRSPTAHSGTITGTTGSLTKVGTGATTLSGAGSSFDNLLVQQGRMALSGGSMTLTSASQGLMLGSNVGGTSGGPILSVFNGAVVSALGTTVQVDGAADTRLDVLGPGSRLVTGRQTLVGNHATGSLGVADGGTLQAGTFLVIGFNPGSIGTLNVLTGGTATSTIGMLGTLAGATGTANVSGIGASWTTAGLGLGGFTAAQRGGNGTLNVGNGGQVRVSDESTLWTAGSRITVNGGSFVTGSLNSDGAVGTIDLMADPTGGAALTVNGASASTFAGTITGGGSLAKSGASVLTLSGVNTFSGATTITGGKIALGNALALQKSTVILGVNDGLNLNGLAGAKLGNLSGTGALALGATQLTIGQNGQSPATYSGTITGSTGSLTKVGTGATLLSGAGSSFDNLLVLQGRMDLSGGSMTLTNTGQGLMLGSNVGGTSGGPILSVYNGAVVSALGINVQVDGAADTRLDVLGTGSRLATGIQTLVGNHATGSLSVADGGTLQAGTFLIMGFNNGSVGTLNILTRGTATSTIGLLGTLTGATGTANVTGTGASWTTAGLGLGGFSDAQRGGNGTLNVGNGGRVSVSDESKLWTAGSRITVNGGSFVTGHLNSDGAVGTIDLVADPLSGVALTIDDTSGTSIYSGAISGDGSLLKTGASTQRLLGTNTFTGTVTVQGGLLEMHTGAASHYVANFGGSLRLGERNLGFAVVQADPGSSVTYTNTTLNGGTLLGGGTHDIAMVNRMTGTIVSNGVVLTPKNGATFLGVGSGGDITNAAGRSLAWTGGSNTVGTLKVAGTTTVSGWSSGGVITVENGGTLVNTGSHLLLAGGSRTTVGSVDAPGGTITLQNGTRMQLNGALLVNNGTIEGLVDVNFGSLAKGGGVYGAVNVSDGGKFSPGNSPGNTVSGDVTWGAGGSYLVELAAATGTAGTHWDLWTIDGTLDVTAGTTSNSRFTISLATLDGADQAALLAGFDNRQAYRWQIVDTNEGVTGFDLAKLKLDTTAFLNAPNGGHFQLALSDGDVFVDFVPAPIPEPHEWALMLVGLSCVVSIARRRRRSGQAA